MRKPTEREKEQYQRLQAIFALGRQRYLSAGGNPDFSGGSLNKQDYLTNVEKKELVEIGQQIFSRDSAKVRS